jgi:hypothetical protein
MRGDEDKAAFAGTRVQTGDLLQHLRQGGRLGGRVARPRAGAKAVDVGLGHAVLGEPDSDRADRIVEDRLGGIAGDQNYLPMFERRRSGKCRPCEYQGGANPGEQARQQRRHQGHGVTNRRQCGTVSAQPSNAEPVGRPKKCSTPNA